MGDVQTAPHRFPPHRRTDTTARSSYLVSNCKRRSVMKTSWEVRYTLFDHTDVRAAHRYFCYAEIYRLGDFVI